MINFLRPWSDKLAISLSFLCTLHCLLLPLLVTLLPALSSLALDSEWFHYAMVLMVIPLSFFALTLGCKKHHHYRILGLGGSGVLLLIAAVLFGHDLGGEIVEKILTVIGASMVALGHVINYRLCQDIKSCECSDD